MATFAAATQKDLRAFAGAIENLIRPLEEAALGSGYNETKLRAEYVPHLDELMAAVETAKALVYK
ncbi:putative structural protein [Pseudomonas phage vB_PaeP_130_113]|uniref:Uncharacterized protein n=2 Tax=Phikmvvirus TaxID=477967 RepID=A0A0A1IVJ7_9CAUD|nr:minor head protein [Pseudomonas phage vB_PaeP_PAO1_Ab05]YP_009800505.1 minor head protein [Pseudomonas phage vB_PaeP_130_113]AVX47664.1 putative structural protein [Pseudomonas phage vB_PaeP_130_113]CEF89315.1 hypothetical protein [Pseudomonas phage vB_PaeP_PAO1_Ab05]